MNETVTKILVSITMFIGIIEMALFIVYGSFVKERDVEEYLDERNGNLQLNPYDKDIISYHRPYESKFIVKHPPISFLSKYQIYGLGRVWRWSDSHKKIEELYEKLNLQ